MSEYLVLLLLPKGYHQYKYFNHSILSLFFALNFNERLQEQSEAERLSSSAEVINTYIILILLEAEIAYQADDFCFFEAPYALILRYGKFSIFYIPNLSTGHIAIEIPLDHVTIYFDIAASPR